MRIKYVANIKRRKGNSLGVEVIILGFNIMNFKIQGVQINNSEVSIHKFVLVSMSSLVSLLVASK